MLDVAIATCDKLLKADDADYYLSQAIYEDSLILDFLRRAGLKAKRISWRDQSTDWSAVKKVLVRGVWDYQEDVAAFNHWLKLVDSTSALCNSAKTIQWNLDKRYLFQLEQAGLAIVPTKFIERGTSANLTDYFELFQSQEIVIKPAISASGEDTYRVASDNFDSMQRKLEELLITKTMMIQPFIPSIVEQGEVSLVVINGKCTHAAKKVAAEGEFRVQDDHGGYAVPYFASEDEIAFAEKAIAQCPDQPKYGRVDIVTTPDGSPMIMEVELFEPELFFRFNREAAESLAKALIND